MRFLVLFREPTGDLLGDAVIVDVSSEKELQRLIAGAPMHPQCTVETIPLAEGSDFPMSFGKQKGVLAAWEKAMARLEGEGEGIYRPYASSSTNRKLRS
jgi:hypothetical protein